MDFKQLESFIAIARFKSFSKAAHYLYITQPTISSHIINLEKELKATLLNRSNKKISLTQAGEILYDYAINMVNLKENVKFKLGEFKGRIIGNIELACSTVPEQYIMPSIMQQFNSLYPDVTFTMMHYDSSQVLEGILNGEIDFGVVGTKINHNQLKYIELLKDEIVLVTPYSEPYISMEDSLDLKSVVKEKFIFREKGSGTRTLIESAFNNLGLSIDDLSVVAYIENTQAIKQCIRNGLGVSFLSKRTVEDEVNFNLLKTFKIEELLLHRSFYLVYHKHRSPSPLEIAFQKYICSYFPNKK
ncbi:MAG: LysR family transcriptional regulator [Clostridiaceae bacterium]|nr:LysR family transcriptional regulator [Clostridiaceae bacterium]